MKSKRNMQKKSNQIKRQDRFDDIQMPNVNAAIVKNKIYRKTDRNEEKKK